MPKQICVYVHPLEIVHKTHTIFNEAVNMYAVQLQRAEQ